MIRDNPAHDLLRTSILCGSSRCSGTSALRLVGQLWGGPTPVLTAGFLHTLILPTILRALKGHEKGIVLEQQLSGRQLWGSRESLPWWRPPKGGSAGPASLDRGPTLPPNPGSFLPRHQTTAGTDSSPEEILGQARCKQQQGEGVELLEGS